MADTHAWSSYRSGIGVVALAASAGGLSVLREVLSGLPGDFPAPVLVCQHRACRPPGEDALVQILSRSCALTVVQARSRMALRSGVIYVAPPDRHLVISRGCVVLSHGAAVHLNRPSADMLFESLAAEFRAGVIAVVLSGSLRDGAVGVVKVKAAGGRVIVQEPWTAECPGMPNAAVASGCADLILPLPRIANAITTLAMVPGATGLFPSLTPAWAVM